MTTVNPSGKTSDFEVPYAITTDAPTSVPVLSKAISERVNAIFKSFKGDATLATNGTVTIASGAVTEPKIGMGAVTEFESRRRGDHVAQGEADDLSRESIRKPEQPSRAYGVPGYEIQNHSAHCWRVGDRCICCRVRGDGQSGRSPDVH